MSQSKLTPESIGKLRKVAVGGLVLIVGIAIGPGLLLHWNKNLVNGIMMIIPISFMVYLFYRMKKDDAFDK